LRSGRSERSEARCARAPALSIMAGLIDSCALATLTRRCTVSTESSFCVLVLRRPSRWKGTVQAATLHTLRHVTITPPSVKYSMAASFWVRATPAKKVSRPDHRGPASGDCGCPDNYLLVRKPWRMTPPASPKLTKILRVALYTLWTGCVNL
jgi:hypothetical protein